MQLTLRKTADAGMTITTDASWHPARNVGGYAFRISSTVYTAQDSGAITDDARNPLDAELVCIIKALSHILNASILQPVHWLVINTDSEQAIKKITSSDTPKAILIRKLLADAKHCLQVNKYELRHVRAHTAVQDNRSKANRWCDQEARRRMRQASQHKRQ